MYHSLQTLLLQHITMLAKFHAAQRMSLSMVILFLVSILA
jgi:hypothetical protein